MALEWQPSRELSVGRASRTVDAHDDVNRGQSSNDVFPSAMHIALALQATTPEQFDRWVDPAQLLAPRASWRVLARPGAHAASAASHRRPAQLASSWRHDAVSTKRLPWAWE